MNNHNRDINMEEIKCPKCSSTNTELYGGYGVSSGNQLPTSNDAIYLCSDCKHIFDIYGKKYDTKI